MNAGRRFNKPIVIASARSESSGEYALCSANSFMVLLGYSAVPQTLQRSLRLQGCSAVASSNSDRGWLLCLISFAIMWENVRCRKGCYPAVRSQASARSGVTPPSLPPHLDLDMLTPAHRAALSSLITQIYLEGSGDSEEVTVEEELTAEIVTCVRLQCALQMRARNRVAALSTCQLPIELWAAVFEHLGQRDCISVSHVSHDWREAAIGCARLWTSSFFLSARHVADCGCYECISSVPCQECGRMSRHENDPVNQVRTFLERSGSLPVDLRMALYRNAASSAISDLAHISRPHAHRIKSLTLSTSDLDAAAYFLQLITAFSALEFLKLELGSSGEDATWICEESAQLPELRTLEILGPMYCDTVRPFRLRCPSVTSLKATFFTAEHALRLLTACPSVQDLQLKVGPRTIDASSTETVAGIHTLLREARPQAVLITNVYEGDFRPLLWLFGETGIPNVRIACANIERVAQEDMITLMCDEVDKPIQLECILEPDSSSEAYTHFSVSVSNVTHMRTCALTYRGRDVDATSPELWDLPNTNIFKTIKNLHASSSLWPILLQVTDNHHVPAITHVQVNFDEGLGDDLRTWLQARAAALQTGAEQSLPQLEGLRFSLGHTGTHQPVTVDVSLADAIRQAFKIGLKLRILELERFSLEGDLTVLQTISEEVRNV